MEAPMVVDGGLAELDQSRRHTVNGVSQFMERAPHPTYLEPISLAPLNHLNETLSCDISKPKLTENREKKNMPKTRSSRRTAFLDEAVQFKADNLGVLYRPR